MPSSETKESVGQSIFFARLAKAAYLNRSILTETGLAKIKNEQRFNDPGTDTQAVAGRYNNDVVIGFRGTEANFADWLSTDLQVGLVRNPRGAGQLHSGFRRAADSVYQALKRFINNHWDDNSRLFLSGHSLGGALAVITASWLNHDARMPNVRGVFTYGAPRVGNKDFALAYKQLGLEQATTMWISKGDPVPHVPPYDFGYRHATKWAHQLDNGVHSHFQPDTAAARAPERSWITNLSLARQLWQLARQLDAFGLKPDEHSIAKSYLPQLMKLRRSL